MKDDPIFSLQTSLKGLGLGIEEVSEVGLGDEMVGI